MSIIYATDFSVSAHAAGLLAVGLARRLRQSIVLVHAVPATYGWNLEVHDADAESARKEAAAAALEATAESLRARGAVVTTDLSTGAPAPQIARLATTHDAEAIVLGSHGRTGINRFVVGSVVDQVLSGATQPVFVVRAEALERAPAGEGSWRTVVVLDGEQTDAGALAWAARLHERGGGETILVRLFSPDIEAARFGIERSRDVEAKGGPMFETLERTLTRELRPFPTLANADRHFLPVTESRATEAADALAELSPTVVVMGIAPWSERRPKRAVSPATLLRALTVPAVCVPLGDSDLPKVIPPVESVLIAVDLADPSPAAVIQAYGLLRAGGGRVELCHVHKSAWAVTGDAGLPVGLTADERAGYERRLRALVPPEAERMGIVTNVSVLQGPSPAQVIAQAGARLAVDVVALATHDRRGVARAMWGSVTEEVLRSSSAPALVVHA
jgi:nucleotide-binding universal stress UspA family protein